MAATCESGFFSSIEDTNKSFQDRELIYCSKTGWSRLFRISENGQYFVYKCLKPEYSGLDGYESLLAKEYITAHSLDHPGICRSLDFIHDSELGNCIVMEWIDGNNLLDYCQANRINRRTAKKIILELCEALDYMHHMQVVHRDIKPQNIMITKKGNNVKLIDFGLADSDAFFLHKEAAGTINYAAPEQIAGEAADFRNDIYSLGLIIGEYALKWYPRVAAKCVRSRKEFRYSSVAAVKRDITGTRRILTVILLVLSIGVIIIGLINQRRETLLDREFQKATQSIIEAQDL